MNNKIWIIIIIIINYIVKKTGYVCINLTIRRVRVITVAVKIPSGVCNLTYPARKAHEPSCHMWPVWFYHILPHHLIHGTIFRKKLLTIKCVL